MDNKNQYLIPANTKRGQLIVSIFRPVDLAIFITGVSVTLILLLIFVKLGAGTIMMFFALLPGLVATGLVIPVANYHNVLVAIQELVNFYSNNRNYKWRGWCAVYESEREQKYANSK